MSLDAAPQETILVVDDTESHRYVIGTYLRRAGYTVVEAATGAEALRATARGGLDLVVLDVNLPDMTGYEVCVQIKQMPSVVLPVLHLSATAVDTEDRSEGLRRGADAYLVEPVDRHELLATIGALLRRTASERMTLDFSNRLRRLNELTLTVHSTPTVKRLLDAVVLGAAEMSQSDAVLVCVFDRLAISAARSGTHHSEKLANETALLVAEMAAQPDLPTGPLFSLLGLGEQHTAARAFIIQPGTEVDSVLLVGVGPNWAAGHQADLLVGQLTQAATTALKNLRNYQTKNAIALTLQRTLLPGVVPAVPGLDVAVRYEASAEYTDVGGDFYEVFALDSTRSVMAIGDVVGHSLEAATAMAQLRTAARAYALEGHGPSATLGRLNSLLARFHPEITATMCLMEFDSETGNAVVANAGHFPPLLVDTAGPRYLEAKGTMLGVVHELEVTTTRFVFEPEQTMVFVTDGLIERRDEDLDVGLDRLASACVAPYGSLQDLCERILREVGPETGPHDDIAIMVLRRT